MKEFIGKSSITALSLLLLVYTASRSMDFLRLTLPPEQQILAWIALAALDGGLLGWTFSYIYGSHGSAQRGISLVMIIIDFLGVSLSFIMDTLYNAGKNGLIASLSPSTISMVTMTISIVIAINIGMMVAHWLSNPEIRRRMAEEESRDEIDSQVLTLIRENGRLMAAEIAPQVADSWKASTVLEYGHRMKKARAFKELASMPALPAEAEQAETNPTPRRRLRKSD